MRGVFDFSCHLLQVNVCARRDASSLREHATSVDVADSFLIVLFINFAHLGNLATDTFSVKICENALV